MKKKNNMKFINIVKIFYIKVKKMDMASFFLFLFKIKSNINLILKFILLYMTLLANTKEFTSIWDLSDFVLRMVEQESTNVNNQKVGDEINNDNALQTTESPQDEKKEEIKEVNFDEMDMDEWFDYLREHEPKAYWFWIFAFTATSVFCIWLMHYLIGPGFPPKEPY